MRQVHKAREVKFLIFYTIFVLYVLSTFILREDPYSILFWTVPGLVLSWTVFIKQYFSHEKRALVMAICLISCFVRYGSLVGSCDRMLPFFSVLLVLTGIFNIIRLVLAAYGTFFLLCIYHGVVLKTYRISCLGDILSVFQLLAVMAVLTYLVCLFISTNKSMRSQLLVTIDSLRQAEHVKDNFMANISHELRTPLNAICGLSELVLQEELSEKTREEVSDMQIAGRNLRSVVSDILDFSELEMGNLEVVEERYNFASVLNDVLNIAMAQNMDKHLELILDCDARVPAEMVGDSEKIRRILSALLQNAIKFTEKGCVVIRVYTRKESYGVNLCVSIRDTGIGMSKEAAEQVFSYFHQVDTKRNRQFSGVGLGLAIAKKMVELQDGFIQLASTEGEGSEFRFVLPQKVSDETPFASVKKERDIRLILYFNPEKFNLDPMRDSYGKCIENMTETLGLSGTVCHNLPELKRKIRKNRDYTHIIFTCKEYGEEPAYFQELAKGNAELVIVMNPWEQIFDDFSFIRLNKPFSVLSLSDVLNGEVTGWGGGNHSYEYDRFTAPSATVLVVDDNTMNIRVMEGLLRPYQCKIFSAESGEEALRAIDRMHFDLVFLDHMMPGMDGVETLHKIRARQGKYYANLPVVAFTANAIGGAREMFLGEGYQEFLPKPVDMSNLNRVMKKLLPRDKIKARKISAPFPHGIQKETGLRYAGGDAQLYREFLELFCEQAAERKREIEDCRETGEWRDYEMFVHALKGNARNIGANYLSKLAGEQEYAAKEERTEDVLSGFDVLLAEYDRVVEEAAALTAGKEGL